MKTCYGKWTREENDTWSVTDYILCSGQLLNRVEKMVVDEEGSMHIQSDHYWLYCDIDLNLNRYIGRPVREVWNITDKTVEVISGTD